MKNLKNPNLAQLIKDTDPRNWYEVKMVKYTPDHFHRTEIKPTTQAISWVQSNTRGRYSICYDVKSIDAISAKTFYLHEEILAFENASDAIVCQLTWQERQEIDDDF